MPSQRISRQDRGKSKDHFKGSVRSGEKTDNIGATMTEIQDVKLKNGQEMRHMKGADGRHVFFNEITFMSKFTFYLLIFMLLFNILANVYIGGLITDSGNKILNALKIIYAESHAVILPGNQTLTPSNPLP
jgi:hypothetical protein